MIYYSIKIKGAGGFVHELLSAPFGAHPLLWIPNLALNIVEYLAKTVSSVCGCSATCTRVSCCSC